MEPEALLKERSSTHGDFAENARVSQGLKDILRSASGWDGLTLVQKEGLDMLCVKMCRIVSGNSQERDHYADLEGYSKLMKDRV